MAFTAHSSQDENAKPMEGGHSHGGGGASPPAAPVGGLQAIIAAIQTILSMKPMDPMGFSTMKILPKDAMCEDCTVLAGKMSVVFENGTGKHSPVVSNIMLVLNPFKQAPIYLGASISTTLSQSTCLKPQKASLQPVPPTQNHHLPESKPGALTSSSAVLLIISRRCTRLLMVCLTRVTTSNKTNS